MLSLEIRGDEYYDEKTERFLEPDKPVTLNLEHSLISISLWESRYKKPFMKKNPNDAEMTSEEFKYYVQCMTLNKNVDPKVYDRLRSSDIQRISEYINDPMTATWFNDKNKPKGRTGKTTTSELIYYWMIANGIPFECQKWHLNRLLTLIRICNEEEAPKKKMSKKDIMAQNAALNKARRAKHHTRG